jgi:predicted acetyltransferase
MNGIQNCEYRKKKKKKKIKIMFDRYKILNKIEKILIELDVNNVKSTKKRKIIEKNCDKLSSQTSVKLFLILSKVDKQITQNPFTLDYTS